MLETITELPRRPERDETPKVNTEPTDRPTDKGSQIVGPQDLHAQTDVTEMAAHSKAAHPQRWFGGEAAMRDHWWRQGGSVIEELDGVCIGQDLLERVWRGGIGGRRGGVRQIAMGLQTDQCG